MHFELKITKFSSVLLIHCWSRNDIDQVFDFINLQEESLNALEAWKLDSFGKKDIGFRHDFLSE